MKCKECGAEIPVGKMFCPECGKETFLVEDFNIMEDLLKQHIEKISRQSQMDLTKEKRDSVEQTEQIPTEKPEEKKKKKMHRILYVILTVFLCSLLAAGILLYQKTHSFQYNFEKGENLILQKQYEKALNYMIRAASLEPQNQDAKIYKMKILCRLDRYEEAKLVYDELSEEEQKCHREDLLLIYKMQKMYDEMAMVLEKTEDKELKEKFQEFEYSKISFEQQDEIFKNYLELKIQATNGGTIYYTTDGSKPDQKSQIYDGEIALTKGKTLVRAVCENSYGVMGPEISKVYTVISTTPEKPRIYPVSGTYENNMTIFILLEEGEQAYYTLDGSEPDENSIPYEGKLIMPPGNTIFSAIVVDEFGNKSEAARRIYVRKR